MTSTNGMLFPKLEFETGNSMIVFDLIVLIYNCMFITLFGRTIFTDTSMFSVINVNIKLINICLLSTVFCLSLQCKGLSEFFMICIVNCLLFFNSKKRSLITHLQAIIVCCVDFFCFPKSYVQCKFVYKGISTLANFFLIYKPNSDMFNFYYCNLFIPIATHSISSLLYLD